MDRRVYQRHHFPDCWSYVSTISRMLALHLLTFSLAALSLLILSITTLAEGARYSSLLRV